jgi:hypothetical protein
MFPWRIEAKICCNRTNAKKVWNEANRVEVPPRPPGSGAAATAAGTVAALTPPP